MSKTKITKDVLAVGALAFTTSVVTEKILLTPKKNIRVTDTIDIPVQGLFALSQNTVASIARSALNTGLPWYARTISDLFATFNLKDGIRETVVWFVYDFLGKYSLNTVFSYFIDKSDDFDRESYKTALSDLIQRYFTEKADRDALIQGITTEIVSILRALTEGTLAALVFNDRFAVALSGTLAAAIDRFIENEAATRITDFFFDMAGHLEKMTIPNFLSGMLGITREKMASYIDLAYDLMLGDKMVTAFENAKFGDAVYQTISEIDFDAVGRMIETDMKDEVLKLNIYATTLTLSFYNSAVNVARKAEKRVNRAKHVVGVVTKVFGKRASKVIETAEDIVEDPDAFI